jgi:hypothetical protein
VAPFSHVEWTYVSEVRTVSIIRAMNIALMMKTVRTSETSVHQRDYMAVRPRRL